MNERIKQLAGQASEIMENTESRVVIARFGSNPSLQDLEDLWNEKFAELIVRECTLQCIHNEDMDLILEYFGVEE